MRVIHDNLVALFFSLLLLVGVISWLSLPAPVQPKTLRPQAEPWALPTITPVDSVKAAASITARKLWGQASDDAQAEPPAPAWSVMGIARNGAERFILMAYEGKPIAQLKVGDSLPDGMKIAKIEDDRFFVTTPAHKQIVFGMYKNEPTK